MFSPTHFAIADATRITARSFDNEVVVANFGSGIYYSLLGSAAEVWTGLMAGVALPDIAAILASRAESAGPAVTASIVAFVERLREEGLIRPVEAGPVGAWQPTAPRGVWLAPELERFTDMHDLLLLDPVHDTSEAGWPYVAAP
jgi:hypothetical protein